MNFMANQKNKSLSKNFFIDLAFEQAKINLGSTRTNPSVGCVVENKGSIISSGVTSINGRPHAEYNALVNRKIHANSNLYVSLEPCSHYGLTPPCTNYIKEKRIRNVYYSVTDFDDRSRDKSKKILKKNQINIKKIAPSRNKDFYKSYFLHHKSKIPFIDAKIAISKDYFSKNKKEKWISNRASRRRAHLLRSMYDCILTTHQTINDDNPQLDCRINGLEKKSPDIFIVDRFLKLNKNLKLFKTKNKRKIFVITTKKNNKIFKYFKKRGVKFILFDKKNNKEDLNIILTKIKRLGYTRVFLESGITFLYSFTKQNLINDLYLFKSNKNLGKNGQLNFKINNLKGKMKKINVNLFEDDLFKVKLKNV